MSSPWRPGVIPMVVNGCAVILPNDADSFPSSLNPIDFICESLAAIRLSIHVFLCDVTDMFVDAVRDIPDMRPLPKTFDYSFCLVSYFWSVVFMSSKTLGHRLARFHFVHVTLESLFYYFIMITIAYVLMPIYLILGDKKFTQEQFPVAKRRVALIVAAFIFGLFSEHIWIHWLHSPNNEPSYYFPFVVGLSLQFAGPILSNNRQLLLMGTVGLATVLSLTIAARVGRLGPKYVVGAAICTAQSTINFQMLIGELRRRLPDEQTMTSGHLKSLIMSVYIHALLTLLNAKYDPLSLNKADLD